MLNYKNYEITLDLKDYEFDGLSKVIKLKLYQTVNALNSGMTNFFGEVDGKKDYLVVAVKNEYGFYIEVFNYKTDTVVDFTIIGNLSSCEGSTTFDTWEGEEYISEMVDFSLNRLLKIVDIKEIETDAEFIQQREHDLTERFEESEPSLIKRLLIDKIFDFEKMDYYAHMKIVHDNIFTDFYAAMIYLYVDYNYNFNLTTDNAKVTAWIKKVRKSRDGKVASKFLNYLNNIPFNELYSLYQQVEKDIKESNPFDCYDTNIEEFIVNMTNLGIIG